jgi:hypothetical protein
VTISQILIVTFLYGTALAAVVYFTRPKWRRMGGALFGAAVVGLYGISAVVLGNELGFWQVPISWTPLFLSLFYLAFSVSAAPIYLVTWRIERRFGWQGMIVSLAVVAIVGPPRDYMYAAIFPEWMVFASGIAPVIADAVTYIGFVLVGHFVMRLVAGPSLDDGLARASA